MDSNILEILHDGDSLVIDLNKALNEELSINTTIEKLCKQQLCEISQRIKYEGKQTTKTEGVFLQKFSLKPFVLDEWEIITNVTNVFFVNKETYQQHIEQYQSYVNASAVSPMCRLKKLYIYLHTHSISGGIAKAYAGDNLQHELEHCFQIIKSGASDDSNDLYEKVWANINNNNNDTLLYKISLCLYYAFNSEQDAQVNGLWQYLISFNEPVHEWDVIKKSSAYQALNTLKDYFIDIMANYPKKELIDCLNDNYHMSLHQYKKRIDGAIRRFTNKFGKVLARYVQKRIKDGERTYKPPCNESKMLWFW